MIDNAISTAYDILSEKHMTENPSKLFRVLRFKALGISNKEIADRLGIHRETVRTWLAKLREFDTEDQKIILMGAMLYNCADIEIEVRH